MSNKNKENENIQEKEAPAINSVFDDLDDLDDAKRVKALSPSMLVFKRFCRNKIAIVGIVIITFMFIFSFIGGMLYPYAETQVFYKTDKVDKEYAGMTYNRDYRVIMQDGSTFPAMSKSKLILAISRKDEQFEVDGNEYSLIKIGENLYDLYGTKKLVDATVIKNIVTYNSKDESVTDEMLELFEEALENDETSFEYDENTYRVFASGRSASFGTVAKIGYTTLNGFKYYEDFDGNYDFMYAAEVAAASGKDSFTANGKSYSLKNEKGVDFIAENGKDIGIITTFMVQPTISGDVIDIDHMLALKEAVDNDLTSIVYGEGDDKATYKIKRKDLTYIVRTEKETNLIDVYSFPSLKHWLGTDSNGMDVLARLMYGGRISLTIGFIVIFLETFIGVILGGIAGFFGKWVDGVIMRIIDIMYCIPTLPIYLILGSIMDTLKIDPKMRIFYMMFVLGIMGWPGIARMVRGQILSLREQEFMIAAEATGISVSRRIFRHLVPNVIPLLIVSATMGLGDAILMESTLSFLGLGVKHPYASWGNIINAVSNVYVMTNFTFVWVPAGILILLTVLGFNFAGDGLRDAFDPRMKR